MTTINLLAVLLGLALTLVSTPFIGPRFVAPALALPIQNDTDPPIPQNPLPPLPASPSVTSRTANSLTVVWNGTVRSGEHYQLQHWQQGGAWTALASVGTGTGAVTDAGLQPDTQRCYRVLATNAAGSRASNARCGVTTDGTGRKVWRAQLQLHTANVSDAGTDDSVSVQLNASAGLPNGNFTWIDYGRNDFERGDTFTYDLDLDHIELLGDITQIMIAKTGDDGWCIADFSLIVNTKTVYTEDFHTLSSGCLWLDSDSGDSLSYTVSHEQLRAHPLWQAYVEPLRVGLDLSHSPQITATVTIPRDETESRIESMVGNLIHGTEAKWGDRHGRAYVEATQGGFPGAHVDVDLEVEVPYWFNPDLDLSFDVNYGASCSADQTQAVINVSTQNLHASVDFNWFTELLSAILPCGPIVSVIEDQGIPDCISALEDYMGNKITASLTPVIQSQRQQLPQGYRCLSGAVNVDADANVNLVFQLQGPSPAGLRSRSPPASGRSVSPPDPNSDPEPREAPAPPREAPRFYGGMRDISAHSSRTWPP